MAQVFNNVDGDSDGDLLLGARVVGLEVGGNDGVNVGDTVGLREGDVGTQLGATVVGAIVVGFAEVGENVVGLVVGIFDGTVVGETDTVGAIVVGRAEGEVDGDTVGRTVGIFEGTNVGALVDFVGCDEIVGAIDELKNEGVAVGDAVGAETTTPNETVVVPLHVPLL